jgi:hypothetical protein
VLYYGERLSRHLRVITESLWSVCETVRGYRVTAAKEARWAHYISSKIEIIVCGDCERQGAAGSGKPVLFTARVTQCQSLSGHNARTKQKTVSEWDTVEDWFLSGFAFVDIYYITLHANCPVRFEVKTRITALALVISIFPFHPLFTGMTKLL